MPSRIIDLYKLGGVSEVGRGIYDWAYYNVTRPLMAKIFRRRSLTIKETTVDFHIANEESIYRSNGHNEKDIMEAFLGELKKSDVIWDVGANQGSYTLLAAKFGSTVHAFEPGEEARRILSRNLEINNLSATVHPVALGDDAKEKILSLAPRSGRRAITEDTSGTPVPILRGIDILAPDPDVIKIDVEGHEIAVLRGLRDRLNSTRIMYIELHEGVSREDIKNEVVEFGFDVEIIREQNGEHKTVRVYKS